MSDKLKLKSIREILDKSFYIPAYQRGADANNDIETNNKAIKTLNINSP